MRRIHNANDQMNHYPVVISRDGETISMHIPALIMFGWMIMHGESTSPDRVDAQPSCMLGVMPCLHMVFICTQTA